jgi:hypothetical protein
MTLALIAGTISALARDKTPEAADKGLGMALMSAAVAYDGTLLSGAGAVSVTHNFTGTYLVFFQRDLTGCQAVVSPGSASSNASVQAGSATANIGPFVNSSTNHVEVFLRSSAGSAGDAYFMLLVFCAK